MREPSAPAFSPDLSLAPTPSLSLPPASAAPATAAIDAAWLDALITSGDHVMTAGWPIPVGSPLERTPPQLLEHEKTLLAAVLLGPADQRERWGLFRRRIGLRFDEAVGENLWSTPALRAIASEIDAIFRGQRDIATINANALREALRERAAAGRWKASSSRRRESLSELIAWGSRLGPGLSDCLRAVPVRQGPPALLSRPAPPSGEGTPGPRHRGRTARLRQTLNEAIAITAGRFRQSHPSAAPPTPPRIVELAGLPPSSVRCLSPAASPRWIWTCAVGAGGPGESTWVLAARSESERPPWPSLPPWGWPSTRRGAVLLLRTQPPRHRGPPDGPRLPPRRWPPHRLVQHQRSGGSRKG